MTPHDLIVAFDTLAEAPDGVKRLRELVLQLAVRGKLVPQDPADEPASVLLERIAAEKARLVKEKVIRKPKALPAVDESKVPYEVPPGWQWVRFGTTHINRDSQRIPLKVGDRAKRQGPFDYYGASGVIDYIDDYLFDGDLLLIGEDGANLVLRSKPIAFMASGQFWVNNHAHVLDSVDLGSLRYLSVFVNAIDLKPYLTGTAQPKLNQSKMNGIYAAFPPLAEQHRIVARVDELMGLLDRLEAARTARDTTRAAARDAALAVLREADTPEEVEVAWNRFAERMDDLLCDPADIDPLRQAVLQLAVRGKLVPQDAGDEPAGVFLDGHTIEPADEPFELPVGWVWTSIAVLGEIRGGGTPSKRNSAFWGGQVPWVSPKDMKRDLIGESRDYITDAAVAGSSVKRIPAGSVLMVVRGMILAHSFPTALTTAEVTINQDMKALLPFDARLAPYLLLATKGHKHDVLNLVERSTHGTCKLPTKSLFPMPFGIPPLAEQRRIVARVDELMGLLDRLKARLIVAQTTHGSFAGAAVHHLDA